MSFCLPYETLKCLNFFVVENLHNNIFHKYVSISHLKETHNSLKKWPFNLWWISNKTIMKVGNIKKAATSKSFLHLSFKNTIITFSVTVLFNIFMRPSMIGSQLGSSVIRPPLKFFVLFPTMPLNFDAF